MTPNTSMDVSTHEGVLPDGTKYMTQVPAGWNGTLLLYSYGPPSPPEAPAWPPGQPLVDAFLRRGYAIARRMPEAYVQTSVGTRLEFTSA